MTYMSEDRFSVLWQRYSERWQGRDDRMDTIDKVVRGDWTVFGPDDEAAENRSPNLIQVALEDTAEAASLVPSVRVMPSKTTQQAKARASKMEQIGSSYLDASEIDLLTIKSMMNLAGHGLFTWVVTYSQELGPRLEWRDPRTCYPEPDQSTLGVTKRAFFARDLYMTQLPPEWQALFYQHCEEREIDQNWWTDHTVTLVEYYDEDCTIVAGVYDASAVPQGGLTKPFQKAHYVSVFLEQLENKSGLCPVIVGQRITLDNEPRGQFDQVIPVLQAHVRLMSLVLDYSDQAVYSDVWVKDLIGEMPYGGGSFIQLGPQGQIGRVPPAVTSLSVYNELDQLINNIHLGGRWPKTRPGDIDQAIASGKFVESTVGMMNTVIRTYHMITQRALEQALRVAFALDKAHGHERTVSGVLRNQQFLLERKLDDIDLTARVNVEYGLGLGRDPAQSMVVGIQAAQAGIVSLEYVQENFDGITDVALERVRLDVQQLKDMAMAKLLQGLQGGMIPESALVEIAKARQNGEDIFALYDKFIVKPKEAQQEQMLTSGLTGEQLMPGQPPPPEAGMGAPVPPPPEELLGLLGGGAGPESIGRLSVPFPGGGFAGTQSSAGPPA